MRPQIGMTIHYLPLDAAGKPAPTAAEADAAAKLAEAAREGQEGSVILLALGAVVVAGLLSTALGL